MSTLLLDIGNSRCKWGLWRDGAIAQTGALAHEISDDPAQWHFASGVERALACNVGGDEQATRIEFALRQVADVELELATVEAGRAGVRCGYGDPSRLGVDRWMAVLAASRLGPRPMLVVDVGTAMTIDALDADGEHLGGYIIPGLQLMQRALTRRTADIRVDAPEAPSESPGRSTSEAVRNGALTSLAGAVGRAANALAASDREGLDDAQFVFTGGDGTLLAETLGMASQYRANLVLEGLAIYAGLAE